MSSRAWACSDIAAYRVLWGCKDYGEAIQGFEIVHIVMQNQYLKKERERKMKLKLWFQQFRVLSNAYKRNKTLGARKGAPNSQKASVFLGMESPQDPKEILGLQKDKLSPYEIFYTRKTPMTGTRKGHSMTTRSSKGLTACGSQHLKRPRESQSRKGTTPQ